MNHEPLKKRLCLRIDADLSVLTAACVLPALLALVAGLWREGQVSSLLLLDVFDLQFVTQDVPAAVVMIVTGLFCLWFSSRNSIENQRFLLERCYQWRWLLAGALFVFCVAGSLNVYRMAAISGDEYANILQTGIFAAFPGSGSFYGQWPAEIAQQMLAPELANRILVDQSGRLITSYQPVFSMLAAPFELAGMRFLFNPLLAAGVVLMVPACISRMTRVRWVAGLGVLMVAGSASVSGFGISSFATNLILFLHLVFLWFVMGGLESKTANARFCHGLGAGLAGGLAMHTGNQMPHLLAAGPLLAWLLYRRQFALLAGMAAIYGPLFYAFTISWTRIVHAVSLVHRDHVAGASGESGLVGAELGWLAAHIKLPTTRQFAQDSMSVLRFLLWASPGMGGLFLVNRNSSLIINDGHQAVWIRPLSRVILVSATLAAIFYFFFPLNQGHGWGYRYLQPVLGFFLVAGLVRWTAFDPDGKTVSWMLLSSLVSLAVMVPLRTSQISAFVAERQTLLPCIPGKGAQICFVDPSRIYWGPDLIQNRPFVSLSQPVVAPLVLRSSGADADEALVQKYWPGARQVEGWNSPGSGSVWSL
ncbi:MAG: hypothetical protein RIQ81_2056 [Pseudomonadota bacterium]